MIWKQAEAAGLSRGRVALLRSFEEGRPIGITRDSFQRYIAISLRALGRDDLALRVEQMPEDGPPEPRQG